ncbi:hypothetical protein OG883_38560 [Streptomyces sp. NBC_01142]|uniref:hypothetical protein n=1 Tax=Streptomyces sp. NBC_01142 TaxID=2975865 RepID=UPI0022500706|nr:hypothetical protein [Streptomyces sp. NBC_01142]MCX4825652.1 hypothetical protein [Streptomyces sp. NBC_01142]
MDPPVTVCFLISKYGEAERSGAVDAWTSHEDIGRSFNGRSLTAEEYHRVEDVYVSAVESVANAVGVDRLELRNVILNQPAPCWLGHIYDGRVVDLKTALLLVRAMLRDGWISCSLESSDILRVGVVTDFYLSVEIQPGAIGSLANVERLGLYPVQVDCWSEDCGDIPLVSRLADEGFWEEVAAGAAVARSAMVVLERWAEGSCGHRWFLVEDENLAAVARSVRSQSLVTAFFDPRIRRASRSHFRRAVSSSVVDDSPVVIFARSAGGDALDVLTWGEGDALPSEAELPAGDELGFFVWPNEDALFVRAVVPGEDGRIVARWPDPRTG